VPSTGLGAGAIRGDEGDKVVIIIKIIFWKTDDKQVNK
jgi:hypothetical protein